MLRHLSNFHNSAIVYFRTLPRIQSEDPNITHQTMTLQTPVPFKANFNDNELMMVTLINSFVPFFPPFLCMGQRGS